MSSIASLSKLAEPSSFSDETPAAPFDHPQYEISIYRLATWLIQTIFYTLWRFMFNFLTGRIQISLSFSTLLLLAIVGLGIAWLYLRYKYLNVYERLTPDTYEPDQSAPFIDAHDPDTKSGFSSYLEEFLSAIKIFGYLDRPVFHELTRSMQTQRLDSGDIFAIDNAVGFLIVVEGSVNVYSKVGHDTDSSSPQTTQPPVDFAQVPPESYTLNGEKFQLINFVKPGNPLSSLVSILTLFTLPQTASGPKEQMVFRIARANGTNLEIVPDSSSLDADSGLPDLVAQAQTDCVVAIIPAELFLRLIRRWPRAALHIVQVVLTRLYRVTLQAAHNYLGLTSEIFETEVRANAGTEPLDPQLYERVMERMSLRRGRSGSLTVEARSPLSSSTQIHLSPRTEFNPGDLLLSTAISEYGTGDSQVRIAVAEKLFEFLGVDETSIDSPVLRAAGGYSLEDSDTQRRDEDPFGFGTKSPRFALPELSEDSSRRSSVSPDAQLDFNHAKHEFAEGLQFMVYAADTTLVDQNGPNKGLFYVLSGTLDVLYLEKSKTGNRKRHVYLVLPGQTAGYLASLGGQKSMVSVTTSSECLVCFLPQETLNDLCEKYFTVHLLIAARLVALLSKQLLDMDFAVEWVQARSGAAVYEQDGAAMGIYLVLSGRFREIKDLGEGKLEKLGEYGQGSSLGELEVLTALKRHSTLVAVRESEAARIPRHLFEFLAVRSPLIMIRISRIVAQQAAAATTPAPYRTITLLPLRYGVPVTAVAERLATELRRMQRSVRVLDQALVLGHLGRHAFDRLLKMKQLGFFSELEERYDLVLYIADAPVNSSWLSTCVAQGDVVLVLADAGSDPEIGEYERLLLRAKTRSRIELVLLHSERSVVPGLTVKWLRKRPWVEGHHHVQFGGATSTLRSQASKVLLLSIKSRVETLTLDLVERYRGSRKTVYTPVGFHKSDFARLARILSGQAIGLVLGGGGARGIAHIGVIQTLENEGIPIDLIGGTSIGAFVGGLYAKEYDMVPIYGRAKQFAGRVASIWRTLLDLTYPLVSYTTGHEFNRGVWKAFGDSRIEDFWIQYFCNLTNITDSKMEYHLNGYAWRFIRALMSLCGLVPPMVDPKGKMLLDGGYVDNLPVDEMKRQGASVVFAVDVGSVDDRTPMTYGDTLSGFLELLNRYNPFSRLPRVPSMADIQLRLAYVGSVGALERAKATPGVFYMRPPVDGYATLAFSRFAEIYDVGKEYSTGELKRLRESGQLVGLIGERPGGGKRARRNSV